MNHNFSALHWTLEQGYLNDEPNVYPKRAIGTGFRSGLTVYFGVASKNIEYFCAAPFQGFKISVHNPGEIPRTSDQYFTIAYNQAVQVKIKPNVIKTSKGLMNYAPQKRQCYFDRERKLKHFKVYTQKNCELECLVDFTFHRCGCVKFSMPRLRDANICSREDEICYYNAELDFMAGDLQTSLLKTVNNEILCNCLPSCTSIDYEIEISNGDYDYETFEKVIDEGSPEREYSMLTMSFKDLHFIPIKRSELYGVIDFLASCGGLLGKSIAGQVAILSVENLKSNFYAAN